MPDPVYPGIKGYIRGITTDYEPGTEIPGISFFKDEHIFARKVDFSTNVNANSVVGEPPYDDISGSIKTVKDFYGTRPFSWFIKADKEYAYLEESLRSIGMEPDKTFFGMYFPLTYSSLEELAVPDVHIADARNREQIGDLVDLSCEIFGINAGERNEMINERMTIIRNPSNRSGFHVAYMNGRPAGYARHRISHDGRAMYLTGSGIKKDFRGLHLYLSLLKHRHEIAKKKGCEFLTVLARDDTSRPILEKLGFRVEGKYFFMSPKSD